MMTLSATVTNTFRSNLVTVSTNGDQKQLSISSKPSGYGSSVNGGELLLLSLATCFCNDIYREAAKRNIKVDEVTVVVTGEFGGEGDPGRNFTYKPHIRSTAPASEIQELIRATDQIAEIHKTLRQGINVTLNA